MLIALLLGWLFLSGHSGGKLWFFGGRTPHEMRTEVAKVVPDKETQNTTNYNLSLIETEYKNLESERSKLEKETLAALERHDTSSEVFQGIETRADEINASATEKMLDVRFVMREQLSEAQWRALFPPPAASSK
jgi:hypothetical protein